MKELKIEVDTPAEKYFEGELKTQCKDEVSCILGATIVGRKEFVMYKKYTISDADFFRIREYILNRKGLES